jgi:deazaflavin-dependent oxidoreductase (nitroreductase family)
MRPMMKLPLVLCGLRLGWLLGHTFMRLTHVGRRSGKRPDTVLAVLHYHRRSSEVTAISAWTASEWYRNIHATPALEVETGNERFTPEQRDLCRGDRRPARRISPYAPDAG